MKMVFLKLKSKVINWSDLTGVEVLLQDSGFDYTNQVIFCDLLYDFGWSRTGNSLSENFINSAIGINSSTILPHSSHVTTPRHNNHHHIQRFSNNFVQNLLPWFIDL